MKLSSREGARWSEDIASAVVAPEQSVKSASTMQQSDAVGRREFFPLVAVVGMAAILMSCVDKPENVPDREGKVATVGEAQTLFTLPEASPPGESLGAEEPDAVFACPAGWVVTDINVFHGEIKNNDPPGVNGLQFLCGRLEPDGSFWRRSTVQPTVFGKEDTDYLSQISCPNGTMARGFASKSDYDIDGVGLRCVSVAAALEGASSEPSRPDMRPPRDQVGGVNRASLCRPGSVLTGASVGSRPDGLYLTHLSAHCRTVQRDPNATPGEVDEVLERAAAIRKPDLCLGGDDEACEGICDDPAWCNEEPSPKELPSTAMMWPRARKR